MDYELSATEQKVDTSPYIPTPPQVDCKPYQMQQNLAPDDDIGQSRRRRNRPLSTKNWLISPVTLSSGLDGKPRLASMMLSPSHSPHTLKKPCRTRRQGFFSWHGHWLRKPHEPANIASLSYDYPMPRHHGGADFQYDAHGPAPHLQHSKAQRSVCAPHPRRTSNSGR